MGGLSHIPSSLALLLGLLLLPLLLANRLARGLALGTIVAMIRDVGADKTARAAPPVGRGVPALNPLLVDGDAALLDVLLVILAEVVAEVIPAVEGLAGAHAPGIVAVVHLLGRLRRVDVLVVPVEVGAALEGPGVAVWVETVNGPVTVLVTKGEIRIM